MLWKISAQFEIQIWRKCSLFKYYFCHWFLQHFKILLCILKIHLKVVAENKERIFQCISSVKMILFAIFWTIYFRIIYCYNKSMLLGEHHREIPTVINRILEALKQLTDVSWQYLNLKCLNNRSLRSWPLIFSLDFSIEQFFE